MIDHYNAFISYRHTERDSKVAAEIQKQLERFKIPKAIQKATGIKKIERIFRDKEELPITSNLSETIENALNNSDYLIVVCSHEMLDSIWVQREINFFLKTHTKKQILTVIADGEPVDVLPEILKIDEIEVEKEDGTKELVTVPAEPLSCDYRMPFKKARKEELPRLVSALIGCSYDSLRQRQRQYRMRRLAAIGTVSAAALVGLTGYFAWSALQIQENYTASLKNQSAYLSAESNRLFSNGDRLSAIMLALEALPSEDLDRPVIPEAIDALVRSTYAYQYPGVNNRSLNTSYTHKGEVDGFVFDDTYQYMYVRHSGYSVTAWDTKTHTELFSKTYNARIDSMIVNNDGNLIILNWDLIECIDGQTGEVLWTYNDMVTDGVIHEELDRIAITHYSIGDTTESEVQILEASTGEVIQSMPKDMVIDDVEWSLSPLCFNPSGTAVAIQMYGDYEEYQVGIWNLEDNSFVYLPTILTGIESAQFVTEDSFLLMSPIDAQYTINGYSYISISKGQTSHIYGKTGMNLMCIDTSGSVIWEKEHPYSLLYSGSTVHQIDYPADDASIPAIIVSVGNSSRIYDVQTGETLNEVTTSDTIVHSVTTDTSITYFLRNGKSGSWGYKDYYSETIYTVSDINIVYYTDNAYVCQDGSNQVLSYTKKIYDTNWENLGAYPYTDYTYHTDNGTLVISDTSENDVDSSKITFISPEGVNWSKDSNIAYSYYNLLGYDDENMYLNHTGFDSVASESFNILEVINFETGETESIDLNQYTDMYSIPYYINGEFIYKQLHVDEISGSYYYQFVTTDKEFNILKSFKALDMENAGSYGLLSSNSDNSTLLLANGKGSFILLKEDDYTLVESGSEEYYDLLFAWNDENNKIAISDENTIDIYNSDGEYLYNVSCDGRKVLSMEFYKDSLLVAFENGVLRRYDAQNGSYQSETDISIGSVVFYREKLWASSDSEVWLVLGNELNIIDTETWKLETTISNCFDFHQDTETFFLCGWEDGMISTEEKCLGKFHRYTVDELISRGKEQLGSVTLTEEQKAQYGIS